MNAATKPEFVVDKLSREHDLSAFDCANATLNDWLRKFAWTNQQADSAKTYVALDGNRVVGYYALTTGSVRKHESPRRIAKGLANHPIGVAPLAKLAVDQSQQGKDLAKLCCSMRYRGSKKPPTSLACGRCLFMPLTRPHVTSICTLNLRSRRSIPISCCCYSRIFGKRSTRGRSNGALSITEIG